MKKILIVAALLFMVSNKISAQSMTINNLNLNCPSVSITLYGYDAFGSYTSVTFSCPSNTSRTFNTVQMVNKLSICGTGAMSSPGWVGPSCATFSPGTTGWTSYDADFGAGVANCSSSTSPVTMSDCTTSTQIWWYDNGFGSITATIQ